MAAINRRPSIENEAFLKSRVKEVRISQYMQDVVVNETGRNFQINGPFTPAIFSTIAWTLTFRLSNGWHCTIWVHSHLRFSQLLREPELIVEQWVTLYYMGAFTPAIWSTIAWTEKFNNGLCTHFLWLRGLKSSRNSSRLKNRRCELSLIADQYDVKYVGIIILFSIDFS